MHLFESELRTFGLWKHAVAFFCYILGWLQATLMTSGRKVGPVGEGNQFGPDLTGKGDLDGPLVFGERGKGGVFAGIPYCMHDTYRPPHRRCSSSRRMEDHRLAPRGN